MNNNSAHSDPSREIKLLLGNDVVMPFDSILKCPEISIGHGTRINGSINIRGEQPCKIGNYCAIGYGVHIITTNHATCYPNLQVAFNRKFGFKSIQKSKGIVEIGHNVWLGDNVTILAGVKIGDGAVIGAGSVVTKDVSAFSIAYGCPAKSTSQRFSTAIVEQLQQDPWWFWDHNRIRRNDEFFNTDLATFEGLLSDIIKD